MLSLPWLGTADAEHSWEWRCQILAGSTIKHGVDQNIDMSLCIRPKQKQVPEANYLFSEGVG